MHDSKERGSFIAGTYVLSMNLVFFFVTNFSVSRRIPWSYELYGLFIRQIAFLKDYIDEKLKTLERVQFHATDGSSTNDVEILSKNKHTSNGLKYTLLQKIK